MLEIKSAVVVVVIIFLKHNGLCGKLADSNYFYTEESLSSMRNAVTVHAICDGLLLHKDAKTEVIF